MDPPPNITVMVAGALGSRCGCEHLVVSGDGRRVLHGRRTAAYPALEPDVEAFGATFEDGAGVVDGQMVSARAWPDHPAWMREFMHLLKEKAPAERAERPAAVPH